ncbi:MAG: peptidoglycan-binding domain-containing protein [Alphaproteobacteria bacterium]
MANFHRLLTINGISYIAFGLIAAGIIANSLFVQTGRHPAPFFQTRALPEPAAATVSGPSIGERALTAAVQEKLRALNYYSGAIDGLTGPETRAAIVAYRTRIGIGGGDRPSAVLLEALSRLPLANEQPLVRYRPAILPDPRPAMSSELRSDERADPAVLSVQNALARAAYGPLTADGIMGNETGDAIRRFQLDNGLALTGVIDDLLIRRMVATGAMEEQGHAGVMAARTSN